MMMTDNVVSTSSIRRTWQVLIQLVFVLSIISFIVFVLIRIQTGYGRDQKIRDLELKLNALTDVVEVADHNDNARLDALEQTLFGEVQPKVAEQSQQRLTQTQVDGWYLNRYREQSEQIRQLQKRVQELEMGR